MQLLILLCFVIAETFLDVEEVKKALEESSGIPEVIAQIASEKHCRKVHVK